LEQPNAPQPGEQLQDGNYELVFKADKGNIESAVLQGLSISIEAIFDKKANMAALITLLH
jgi:hypothetical protein